MGRARQKRSNVLQTYTEEKGFAFIARCVDGTEIFGHKREFAKGLEPEVRQPVSFVYEVTEKGGTAKKVLSAILKGRVRLICDQIRLEDSVPEIPLSDEGREFGTIKVRISSTDCRSTEVNSAIELQHRKGFWLCCFPQRC